MWGREMGAVAEEALYGVVKRYLDEQFSIMRQPRSGIALWRSQITSRIDIELPGKWTRPDLAAIHVWRHRFAPTFTVDLHGFEVKQSDAGNEISLFEALAHTRIVHYGHLVWHVPEPPRSAERLHSILVNCRAFGVGLITFRDHTDPSSFEVHEVAGRRATPDLELVDRFVAAAFAEHVETIDSWLPRGP